MLADVSQVIGRSFVSSKDNVARIVEMLGPGGMKVNWKTEPTELEIKEFEKWLEGILGCSLDALNFDGAREGSTKEREAYNKFLKENG